MDKLLILCFEDSVQAYKSADDGRFKPCPYRENESFTFSNNKNIWEDYWEYMQDVYLGEKFGVACIYVDFDFSNVFSMIEPLKNLQADFLQINSLESVLPEIMLKKRLLEKTRSIFVQFNKRVWEVTNNSCIEKEHDKERPAYHLSINDILSSYFVPIFIGKDERIIPVIQESGTSGDIANYVNSSKIEEKSRG